MDIEEDDIKFFLHGLLVQEFVAAARRGVGNWRHLWGKTGQIAAFGFTLFMWMSINWYNADSVPIQSLLLWCRILPLKRGISKREN